MLADKMTLQGWKMMHSAPRDGRDIDLIKTDGSVDVGFWRNDTSWNMVGGENAFDDDFSGWRERE